MCMHESPKTTTYKASRESLSIRTEAEDEQSKALDFLDGDGKINYRRRFPTGFMGGRFGRKKFVHTNFFVIIALIANTLALPTKYYREVPGMNFFKAIRRCSHN